MKLPPLNSIRAFEATARHLSFKLAAEELFVTPAAISYQIKSLEDYLGVRLFIRENRSILMTPAAQRCYNEIKSGFEQIAKGIEKAQSEQNNGVLTVSAGPAFTIKWLAPRLHEFIDLHPDIDAKISASLTFSDLRHDTVDAAIRFGNSQDPSLYSEKLADEVLVPLCHPNLLKGKHPLTDINNLRAHPLIHDDSVNFKHDHPGWAEYIQEKGVTGVNSQKGVRFNQADHALQAAIDGNGILLGRRTLALPDLLAGRLIAPFGEWKIETHLSYYFVCLKEKAEHHKIQAFKRWISQLLQGDS